jgi:antitoxin ParD1/3/4
MLLNSDDINNLENHFGNLIQDKIKSGLYSSPLEVIEKGLELLSSEEFKILKLRELIEEGENSEIIDNYDLNEHLRELHSKHEN